MAVSTYKFLFHLHLECQIGAVWKRSAESAKSKVIAFSKGSATFDQTLTLPVNMYFDSNTNSFQQKKSQLNFTLHTQKGDKSAGVIYIDLSLMLNNKLEVIQDKLSLEKCPDKNAKVQIKITCQSKGQYNPSEASVTGPLDVTAMSITSLPGLTPQTTETNLSSVNEPRKQQIKQETKLSNNQQNQKLKNQIQILKAKYTKSQSDHKKQIQKLNNQIQSIKQELNKSKSNQDAIKKQYTQFKHKQVQYEQAKRRLQLIYQELQQYI